MARLQDFQTVTPTSADKLLVVQSQGQGLVAYGAKLDSANPTGTGSLSMNRKASTTVGTNSVAEGNNCTASGATSHAEGTATNATGDRSHSEGSTTTASGARSHAEGDATTSGGTASHAEGAATTASGNYSHAEGYGTNAGLEAHAEGNGTTASGVRSHTEGRATIANHRSQHVFGEFNTADASTAQADARGNYVEIVGNGANDANRSNARTLDWNGNEVLAGTLTQSSDARLKEVNAEDIPDVSDIKAIRFNWKKNIGRDFSEHIGYLAQDVEQVLPFLVKEDAEGNKTLDYIAFLVAKIDSLEKRISELEKGE